MINASINGGNRFSTKWRSTAQALMSKQQTKKIKKRQKQNSHSSRTELLIVNGRSRVRVENSIIIYKCIYMYIHT